MFLAPALLWTLGLAALPILAHLAFRRRRKRVAVPSLLFLERAAPRLSARRRLRDWLVLILRCLVIAAAALAVARPQWAGIGGGGSACLVLVVDTSGSMAAETGDGRTRLQAATELAGALVAALRPGDRAAVLPAVADPAVPQLAPTGDRDRLRAVLAELRPTQAGAQPAGALARAAAVLAAAGAPRREVHIFTDAQTAEWGSAGEPQLPPGTTLVVHRVAAAAPAPQVALAALRLPDRQALAGRPLSVAVALENPSAADAAITVHLADDVGRRASGQAQVPAGGRADLPLALPAGAPGTHWLRAWIEGDRFAPDNEAFAAYRAVPPRPCLLLGTANAYGPLPLALAPAADGSLSGLTALPIEAAALAAALAQDPALLAATADRLAMLPAPAAAAVERAVAGGLRLLVLPPAGREPGPITGLPPWVGGLAGEPFAVQAGLPLLALAPRHPSFRDLVGQDGAIDLGRGRALKGLALVAAPGAVGVLGTADGKVLLQERPHGRGAILACGLLMHPAWTTLPAQPAFLAFAQGLALPPGGESLPQLVAGSSLPATGAAPVRCHAITGPSLDWQGSAGNQPAPPRAGVIAVSDATGERLVAIRADPREGDPGMQSGDRLPALGGLPHAVDDPADGAALVAGWERARTGLDLAPWLWALALALFACEGWLANRALVRDAHGAVGSGKWEAGGGPDAPRTSHLPPPTRPKGVP